jgi:hypothetical protein
LRNANDESESEWECEIGKPSFCAQSIYNAASTFYSLLSAFFLLLHIQNTYSNTTKMATIHDKLAQVQFEEKLKATILCES